MTVVSLTYNSDWLAGLNPLGLRSEQRAISSTARQLEEQWVDALDYQTTVSIGERWNRLVTAIQDVADEASEPDWDGHGALQANEMAVRWAFQFALSLPRDLPLPQPSIDKDGEVSFEWYLGPRAVFSVSVAPNGTLSYAGLYGHRKCYGVESLDSSVPEPILEGIRRLTRDASAFAG
ncbi:MAG: hypothetical protein KDA27_23700 [Candidatus Eisenbacteria bacterium]|uniref:Uncharacterized protein n=1 Tax=Eiseniibacteriota bacterium TaxID=2212470 RepID=A0A956NKL9_UNCEI|nr:hypothetical protein [Candidatus Eisenbacteria bacterium]